VLMNLEIQPLILTHGAVINCRLNLTWL
jgi:hypothetical protein